MIFKWKTTDKFFLYVSDTWPVSGSECCQCNPWRMKFWRSQKLDGALRPALHFFFLFLILFSLKALKFFNRSYNLVLLAHCVVPSFVLYCYRIFLQLVDIFWTEALISTSFFSPTGSARFGKFLGLISSIELELWSL